MAPLLSALWALLCLNAIATCVTAVAMPGMRRLESRPVTAADLEKRDGRGGKIAPKVFILNAFGPEAGSFLAVKSLDLYAQNITVPGLSPRFPEVHCSRKGAICQVATGEGEINAATSITALIYSGAFDLTKTYFLIAGIAGINPLVGTTGAVTFARFEVQVALQYEFDIRDLSSNFSTGYIPYGTKAPLEYPQFIYGTEVFELNDALRSKAVKFAQKAKLNDSTIAQAYRQKYPAPANKPPSIIACDGATSDVYYSGNILSGVFGDYTKVITNGTGNYCATAQEDSAIMEALLRGAKAGVVDFGRIIAMRTAANFDRPPPGVSAYQFFFYQTSGGFLPSVANLALAGVPIIEGIVGEWDQTYRKGVKAKNYIGDIFGTLGGTPDFGPYPYFGEG